MFLFNCFVIMSNSQKQSRETSVKIRGTVPRLRLILSQQIWKSSAAVVQIFKPLFSNCLHSGLSHPYSTVQLTTNTKATLEIKNYQESEHLSSLVAKSVSMKLTLPFYGLHSSSQHVEQYVRVKLQSYSQDGKCFWKTVYLGIT